MFLRNAAAVFLSSIFVAALALLSKMVMARSLGPDGVGRFYLLATFVTFLLSAVSLGTDAATTYFLSRPSEGEVSWAAAGFWTQLSLAAVGISLCVAAPRAVASSPLLAASIDAPLLLLAVLCLAPLSSLVGAFNSILVGRQELVKYTAFGSIGGILRLCCLFIALVVLRGDVHTALWASGVALALTAGGQCALLRRDGVSLRLWVKVANVVALLKYGIGNWIGGLLQSFNYRFDTFVVNYFLGAAFVGQYSIAVAFAEMIWFVPGAVTTVLFPRTAADVRAARDFTPLVARIVVFSTGLIAGVFALFGVPVIAMLFGRRFEGAGAALLGLLPGIVFLSLGKVVASDLAGRGKPHYGSLSAFVGLGATIALDFLLIPRFGILGAGIASSVSYGVSAAVLVWLYCRLTAVSPRLLWLIRREDFRFCRAVVSERWDRVGSRARTV